MKNKHRKIAVAPTWLKTLFDGNFTGNLSLKIYCYGNNFDLHMMATQPLCDALLNVFNQPWAGRSAKELSHSKLLRGNLGFQVTQLLQARASTRRKGMGTDLKQ